MKKINEGDLYRKIYDVDPTAIYNFILRVKDYFMIYDTPEILDIGAGTGRFVDLFTQLGWKVTAAEPYKVYYQYLLDRFRNQGNIMISNESFQSINYTEQFDMILAINGPFSYLLNGNNREAAIKNSYAALKKNGILLIDTSNFSWILKNYRAPKDHKFELYGRAVEQMVIHEFDYHQNIMSHINLFKIEGQNDITTVHKFYMVGFQEIEYLLKKNNFVNIATYNSYDALEPCPIDNKRMIIVAQKI